MSLVLLLQWAQIAICRSLCTCTGNAYTNTDSESPHMKETANLTEGEINLHENPTNL